MSLHRFFVLSALPPSGSAAWEVPLSRTDIGHLSRVLRMGEGDRVILADAAGSEAEARLVRVDSEGIVADVPPPRRRGAGPRVALAQGLTRRERMETAIVKTTEIGVSEVLPVEFARSVVHLDDARSEARTMRWQRLAAEAAKQSQRATIPVVRQPVGLPGLLDVAGSFDIVLVPWEEAADSAPGVGAAIEAAGGTSASSVLVVIGPEGGLEAAEVAALEGSGALRVSLGDTILRTETAAIVATALVLYALGGLGGREC